MQQDGPSLAEQMTANACRYAGGPPRQCHCRSLCPRRNAAEHGAVRTSIVLIRLRPNPLPQRRRRARCFAAYGTATTSASPPMTSRFMRARRPARNAKSTRSFPAWTIVTDGARFRCMRKARRARSAIAARRCGARSAIGAAAMLAHEIKNPLSGIRGAAQLLGEGGQGGRDAALTTADHHRSRSRGRADRPDAGFHRHDRPLECPNRSNIYPLLDHVRPRSPLLASRATSASIEERYRSRRCHFAQHRSTMRWYPGGAESAEKRVQRR